MNREPIMAALWAKVSGLSSLATASRVLKHYSEVAAVDQPALFMAPVSHTAQRTRGLPIKWTLDVDLYLYVNKDSSVIPDAALNALLDGIEAALAPPAVAEVQTLGGLCEHAWIEGVIQIDISAMGAQLLCVVPLRILATT